MTLLLDPMLLEPPGPSGAPLPPDSDFWRRIVDWAADHRAKLGSESHELVCSQYARHGYPTQNLKFSSPTLQRDYQAALGRLLSRVIAHSCDPGERELSPNYSGNLEQKLALEFDVAGTVGAGVLGLATAEDHWDTSARHVYCDPPSPARLALCTEPGADLAEEQSETVKNFFYQLRLHVVGARPDAAVIADVVETLGVNEDDVHWLPCERARPPRNLGDRWSGLRPGRDITVCITGRVGHATSEKAQSAAAKSGVPHLRVELPSQIVSTLEAYAVEESNRLSR